MDAHFLSATRQVARFWKAVLLALVAATSSCRYAAQGDDPASGSASGVRQPSTPIPAQSELDRSDSDPRNWLTYNKGYLGYRYSTLSQIAPANARDVKLLCVFRLGEKGSFQNGPLVYDGVMYVTSALGTYAIDAASCDKRWEYRYPLSNDEGSNNKGAAIAEGRLIRGTPDGHLIALDAANGALLWDRPIMNAANGEYATAAPLIWNGLVYMGKAGGDLGIRGEMMAFKASDGTKVWGFHTVPGPGETGSDTWKIPASIEHGGGGLWTAFSLDRANHLLLIPVGNPGPDFADEVRPGTNLFTDSVVALDARTGKLIWWHQWVGPDDRDWDTAVVAGFDASDGGELAAIAGKEGLLHVVDRTSGKVRFETPLVERFEGGKGPVPTSPGLRICPIAAVQWNGPSYSRQTNLLYMNGIDWCAQGIKGPTPVYERGEPYLGWANFYGDRDPLDQAYGFVNAIDAASGAIKWRYKTIAPPLGAIATTASGLLATGDTNGNLILLDARSGALLAQLNLGGALGGGVITYEVKGRQFIAAAVGNNSPVYKTSGENVIAVLGIP